MGLAPGSFEEVRGRHRYGLFDFCPVSSISDRQHPPAYEMVAIAASLSLISDSTSMVMRFIMYRMFNRVEVNVEFASAHTLYMEVGVTVGRS
jgi:hypothetical protein